MIYESTTVEMEYPVLEERIFRHQAIQDVLSAVIDPAYFEFTIGEFATLIDGIQTTLSKVVDLFTSVGVVEARRGDENMTSRSTATGSDDVLLVTKRSREITCSGHLSVNWNDAITEVCVGC